MHCQEFHGIHISRIIQFDKLPCFKQYGSLIYIPPMFLCLQVIHNIAKLGDGRWEAFPEAQVLASMRKAGSTSGATVYGAPTEALVLFK
jgi:hypothetical protein